MAWVDLTVYGSGTESEAWHGEGRQIVHDSAVLADEAAAQEREKLLRSGIEMQARSFGFETEVGPELTPSFKACARGAGEVAVAEEFAE